MNQDPLLEAKNAVEAMALGRDGVHAVGATDEQILLYSADEDRVRRSSWWVNAQKKAAPFQLIIVTEKRPHIQDDD